MRVVFDSSNQPKNSRHGCVFIHDEIIQTIAFMLSLPMPAIAVAWIRRSVSSVSLCACVSVCVLKEKRLNLSIVNTKLGIQMAGPRHALSQGQMVKVRVKVRFKMVCHGCGPSRRYNYTFSRYYYPRRRVG